MECRNCGKKRLRNLQSLRAHLRWCPERPGQEDRPKVRESAKSSEKHSNGIAPLSDSHQAPYTSIPLDTNPVAGELEQVALRIGVPPLGARITSNYLIYVANLDDPLSMWDEMQHCPEVSPACRRRWIHMWCSTRGIPLAPWQKEVMALS